MLRAKFQYSIKGLFCLTFLAASSVWGAERLYGERPARELVSRLGGRCLTYRGFWLGWCAWLGPERSVVWSVDLRGTPVEDDDLRVLRRLQGLTIVDLRETNISEAGLGHLRCLAQLDQVYVSEDRITQATVARFPERLIVRK
ncbi:MAG TPA: hypothetical protein VGX76_21265 [Pirellulales bacterium]|nr:hypothetical protein [Pirellulales bacterium]